jgi:peptidoglycan/LPS O-acetylase OafA/YrhL
MMVGTSKHAKAPSLDRRPVQLPSLTGMRFIAAAMVFFFHASYANVFSSPRVGSGFASVFGQGGWTGVGFFFVLSGFVLAWSARSTDTTTSFWRRRFFKIYPNHLVTLAAAFLLLALVAQHVVSSSNGVPSLLLVQAWFPQLTIENGINPVSWSLSCEVLFYLSFPLLLRAMNRIRPTRLWAWTGGVVLAIILIPVVAMALPSEPVVLPAMHMSQWQGWFIYKFPPVRMLDFVFGMFLAKLVMTGRKMPLGLGATVVLAIAAYALAPLAPGRYPLVAVTVVPLGLLIAAGAVADVEQRRNWLSSRTMIWLGELSFAFYLWHYMVIVYGRQLLAFGAGQRVDMTGLAVGRTWGTPMALVILAALFGATLLLSWALFAAVERPVMRHFATARRRPDATAEPSTAGAREHAETPASPLGKERTGS